MSEAAFDGDGVESFDDAVELAKALITGLAEERENWKEDLK